MNAHQGLVAGEQDSTIRLSAPRDEPWIWPSGCPAFSHELGLGIVARDRYGVCEENESLIQAGGWSHAVSTRQLAGWAKDPVQVSSNESSRCPVSSRQPLSRGVGTRRARLLYCGSASPRRALSLCRSPDPASGRLLLRHLWLRVSAPRRSALWGGPPREGRDRDARSAAQSRTTTNRPLIIVDAADQPLAKREESIQLDRHSGKASPAFAGLGLEITWWSW